MKIKLTYCLFTLLLFTPAICRAEQEITTHTFSEMTSPEITYSNSNKTATTDFVTYTCSGSSAVFNNTSASGNTTSIFLTTTDDNVSTSPAIEDLTQLEIFYSPKTQNLGNTVIAVMISTDGSEWTDISSDAVYNKGQVSVDLPVRGNYQVRIKNKNGTDFYVFSIKYTTESCNCFVFQKE